MSPSNKLFELLCLICMLSAVNMMPGFGDVKGDTDMFHLIYLSPEPLYFSND